MDAYAPEIERVMKRLSDSLREKDRRRYAAVEATKLGHGGVEYVARRWSRYKPMLIVCENTRVCLTSTPPNGGNLT